MGVRDQQVLGNDIFAVALSIAIYTYLGDGGIIAPIAALVFAAIFTIYRVVKILFSDIYLAGLVPDWYNSILAIGVYLAGYHIVGYVEGYTFFLGMGAFHLVLLLSIFVIGVLLADMDEDDEDDEDRYV